MYNQFRITSIKVKITPTQCSTFNQAGSTINAEDNVKELYNNAILTLDIIYKYNKK